ncbi:putative coactivator CBP, KIX domain superfamily, mediator complex subunit 15, KIX [Helianthus annuus]|nr:putative coactivator CBP, KIX domain superfamily, mediator complex subunit 15, KIX [Helianthus annuus]
MLTMETRLQNYVSDSMYSNSAAISVNSSVHLIRQQMAEIGKRKCIKRCYKNYEGSVSTRFEAYSGCKRCFGEPTLEHGDWRATVQADSRQRIVNKIMETLKRHVPFDGPEGLQELMKMAMKFEQRMYTLCTSQSD